MAWEDKSARPFYEQYNHLRENDELYIKFYHQALENIESQVALLKVKIDEGQAMLTDVHDYKRLSEMKKNIDKTISKLEKQVGKTYMDDVLRSYNNILQSASVELGDELAVGKINKELFKELAEYPYTGKPFSERLWLNMSNVNEIITRGLVQGMSFSQMSQELKRRMNKGLYECHRLIRNESAILLNQGKLNAYKQSGLVKEVQWYAALDERMCPSCGALHNKTFKLGEEPAKPHIMCRCTFIPVIE